MVSTNLNQTDLDIQTKKLIHELFLFFQQLTALQLLIKSFNITPQTKKEEIALIATILEKDFYEYFLKGLLRTVPPEIVQSVKVAFQFAVAAAISDFVEKNPPPEQEPE